MKVVDVHTHGIDGFDTRSSTVDGMLRIAEIHGAAGVSKIVLSIYPAPIREMRRQIELVREAMERQVHGSGVAVHGGGARILGVHLEGPFLNPTRSGALNPSFFIDPEERVFRELIEGFEDSIVVITVAPERKGAGALIRKVSDLGIVVSMGHSDATYSEAEAGLNAGARGITHLFNGMRGFHHREPGLAGFGLLNRHIYVEVIADPFHLHDATLKLIFEMKEPNKIVLVSDSVKETRTAGGYGRIDDPSGRLQGGSMTITESARRLVALGLRENTVMNAVTNNPRQYLMLKA